MQEELDQQDALLDKEYKRQLISLSGGRKKQLQELQGAWGKYRDLNCDWYANPNGGSSAYIDINQCYLHMIVTRLIELSVV